MKTILISNSTAYLAQSSKEWGRLTFSSVDGLVTALGKFYPKGSKVRLIYQSSGLSVETEDVPPGKWKECDEVLRQRHSGLESPLLAWCHKRLTSDSAMVLHETKPFLLVLHELLESRYAIKLESAVPWSVFHKAQAADSGRLAVAVIVDHVRAWIEGVSSTGEWVSRFVEGESRDGLLSQLKGVLQQLGAVTGERSGLPGRLRFVGVSKLDELDEAGWFWKEFSSQNHCSRNSLFEAVNQLAASDYSGGQNFVRHKSIVADFSAFFKVLAVSGVAAGLCLSMYWYLEYHRLCERTAALRAKVEASRAVESKIKAATKELAELDALYSADAGWGRPAPYDLLRSLGQETPPSATLDLFEWSESGRVVLKGTVWKLPEKQTFDACLKQYEASLQKAGTGFRLDQNQREVDAKAAKFGLVGALGGKAT